MTQTPVVVAGDTLPALKIQLADGAGTYDPTLADTVTVKIWQDETLIVNAAPTSIDASGLVTYQWHTGETDNPGPIKVRVVLAFAGHTETFPTKGYAMGTIQAASPVTD